MMRTSSPNSYLGSISLVHRDRTDRHELHLRFVHVEHLEHLFGERVGFHEILVGLLQQRGIDDAARILVFRQRRLDQIVVEALQDVQAVHLHHRRLELDAEIVQEILGGSQFFHCLVQCQCVHLVLLVCPSLSMLRYSTSSSALPPMRSWLSSSTSFFSIACPVVRLPRRRLI